MADLATGLLATMLAEAAGLAGQAIAGRRLGAVVAVLGQSAAQLVHFGDHGSHLLAQDGVFGFQLGDTVFGRHAFHAPYLASPEQLQCGICTGVRNPFRGEARFFAHFNRIFLPSTIFVAVTEVIGQSAIQMRVGIILYICP
jgi:hypothetical protein